MGTHERAIDRGNRKSRKALGEAGEELRRARVEHGLSQLDVAKGSGLSRWQVSRVERGAYPNAPLSYLSRLAAVVGLDLAVRLYPGGSPIRDAAHRALLDRFTARLAPSIGVRYEVPLPGPGDQRAWDEMLAVGRKRIGVEGETRATDGQALQRRLALKLRDDPRVDHVILLLADTRANRRMLAECGAALRTDFPLPGDAILRALGAGENPGGSGIVLL